MRRVGFQAHDGRIFETLTGRGGILVAIHSEPRAADALAHPAFLRRRQRRDWRLDRPRLSDTSGVSTASDSLRVVLANTHEVRGTPFAVAAARDPCATIPQRAPLPLPMAEPPRRPKSARTHPPGICPSTSKGASGRRSVPVRAASRSASPRPSLASLVSHVFIVVADCARSIRYAPHPATTAALLPDQPNHEHHLAEPAGSGRRRWRRRQQDEGAAAQGGAAGQGQDHRSGREAAEARAAAGQERADLRSRS